MEGLEENEECASVTKSDLEVPVQSGGVTGELVVDGRWEGEDLKTLEVQVQFLLNEKFDLDLAVPEKSRRLLEWSPDSEVRDDAPCRETVTHRPVGVLGSLRT